jgi:hypothetical protein
MTMKIELPEIGHRNLVPFEAIAMYVDKPVDAKPHFTDYDAKKTAESDDGAPKLVFKRSAVEEALPSLIGMGVNAQEGALENHAFRSTVGLITEAWLDGNAVMIRGFIYGFFFSDLVQAIKTLRTKLGACPSFASMVVDLPEEEKPEFMFVNSLLFTGCAILQKKNCAFEGTQVRILQKSYRWPCKETHCPHFMNGEVQGFCSEHQSKR